jgi:hypothetical protein
MPVSPSFETRLAALLSMRAFLDTIIETPSS